MQDNLIVFPEPPPGDNVQLVAPILPVPLTQLVGVVTVNFHVRSIYSKLGVNSRSAATRYTIEHNLV